VHRSAHLGNAKLGVEPKGTSVAAMEGGDGNGGPQPWLAGSGELGGSAALPADLMSISGSRRTQNTREGRW
jgi:hypothetical protein